MNLAQKLQAYEERHAPKTFPDTGNTRFPHWYCLTMYSDGSGYVEDANSEKFKEFFDFMSFEELLEKLKE